MKLARLGPDGHERPCVLTPVGWHSIETLTADIDGQFLDSDGPARVALALAEGRLPRIDDADRLRVGPPVARPGAVVCVGMNYAAHAAESGAAPPEAPIMFLKAPNTVTGPFDQLTLPRNSSKTDWEVELGVVIGRAASYLDSTAQAMDCIAGFVVANDVSEREFQLERSGGQWSKGKVAPGFTPLGPWLVTPDEVDHSQLRLRSRVNGSIRQDSTTADLIFDVAYLIHHLSQFMCLDPGDVVLTGTPEGVALSGRFPYLQPGDVVEVEIDGLGHQRQECRAWEVAR